MNNCSIDADTVLILCDTDLPDLTTCLLDVGIGCVHHADPQGNAARHWQAFLAHPRPIFMLFRNLRLASHKEAEMQVCRIGVSDARMTGSSPPPPSPPPPLSYCLRAAASGCV